MKLGLALVFLLGCAAEPPQPKKAASPGVLARINASADLDGKPVGTSDEPTVVIVFASWCPHCKDELVELDAIRGHHVRMLGVNYRGHEEYDHRGNSVAVRAFADRTPWLRVVPIDDALYQALGSPPQIPTMYVFDRAGTLVETYDRRTRKPPGRDELVQVLARLGS